jgi:hypothetical protein
VQLDLEPTSDAQHVRRKRSEDNMSYLQTLQNLFTLTFVITSMASMGLSLTIAQILQPLKRTRGW